MTLYLTSFPRSMQRCIFVIQIYRGHKNTLKNKERQFARSRDYLYLLHILRNDNLPYIAFQILPESSANFQNRKSRGTLESCGFSILSFHPRSFLKCFPRCLHGVTDWVLHLIKHTVVINGIYLKMYLNKNRCSSRERQLNTLKLSVEEVIFNQSSTPSACGFNKVKPI